MNNNESVQRIKNSKSESFKKLNPHLFGPQHCAQTAVSMLPVGKSEVPFRQSKKPLMNNLESDFRLQLIVAGWKHILCQSVKLRLGNGVWYTPDFITFGNPDDVPVVFWEVKGNHVWDDAIVKLKVAAHAYPYGEWRLAHRAQGNWGYQIIRP